MRKTWHVENKYVWEFGNTSHKDITENMIKKSICWDVMQCDVGQDVRDNRGGSHFCCNFCTASSCNDLQVFFPQIKNAECCVIFYVFVRI